MSGITTEQMLNATGGSIYIWPNLQSIGYAVELANKIGRGDLKIYPLSALDRGDSFRGVAIYGLSIDHACAIKSKHLPTIRSMEARAMLRDKP